MTPHPSLALLVPPSPTGEGLGRGTSPYWAISALAEGLRRGIPSRRNFERQGAREQDGARWLLEILKDEVQKRHAGEEKLFKTRQNEREARSKNDSLEKLS
jgi:hypothetical protein